MKYRQFLLLIGCSIFCTLIFLSACKKINDDTALGGDLIPPVDNISTFDTTLEVETYNELFTGLDDSMITSKNITQYVGKITNDALFGGTEARMFFELKPFIYPSIPFARKDSLAIDSVVLVLDYTGVYGDSTVSQTLNAYEIDQGGTRFALDTNYLIRQEYFTYSSILGTKTFTPSSLRDSVKVLGDSTVNQLRIKLDNAFGTRLLSYDSAAGANGAYASDSAFRTKFKGFALRSENSGNALMGFNIIGANSKLAIYYKYPKPGLGYDTTGIQYFRFTDKSAIAQYVQRDHTMGEMAGVQGGGADQLVYIQGTPGSFAKIKIPGLVNMSNRIVHRAELMMEQVADPSDDLFATPAALYLDAIDSSITLTAQKIRTIPYDLDLEQSGTLPLARFGIFPSTTSLGGSKIKVWKLNISRYVQNALTKRVPVMNLRLYAPYIVANGVTRVGGGAMDLHLPIQLVNPTIITGRVRLGGGSHASQKMKLRIIYSKI